MTAPEGIHAETTGEGPPLVLVHAGICDSRMWDPQWRSLARRHRLVRHDMRGFGRSPMPPGAYSHARDLVAVMDAAGLSDAVVVGASMGGRVALEVTVARRVHAMRCARSSYRWRATWRSATSRSCSFPASASAWAR